MSSAVDTALVHAMFARLNALNASPNLNLQPTPGLVLGNDLHALAYTTIPLMTNSICQSARPNPNMNQTMQVASVTPLPIVGSNLPSLNDSIEKVIAKRFVKMEAMIQRIPGVPTPIKKSLPHSYADSPFVDSITLVEIPKKLSFPNMKTYDGTTDPTDHIASYKLHLFTIAIPREQREACMCKSFGSSLQGPALQWYMNLPKNSISSFA